MKIDLLAIGAHPDDVELIAGGTIAKLTSRGKKVVILDLTRGEMGTRGSAEKRAEEAAKSASILGVFQRVNLDLGDGRLENSQANQIKVIEIIRHFKPTIIMTHHWNDLHPDHIAAGELLKRCMYLSGMDKFPAKGEPYRPNEVLFFMAHLTFEPSFIVDITNFFEIKMKAIKCYKSQLYDPSISGRQTNISRPEFLKYIEARAIHYGSMISTLYGEPFFVRRAVPVDDPVELYKPFPKL